MSCRFTIFYTGKQFEDSFIYVSPHLGSFSLQSLSGFRSSNDAKHLYSFVCGDFVLYLLFLPTVK